MRVTGRGPPRLQHAGSVAGDTRHCITLAWPCIVEQGRSFDAGTHPLVDQINVLLTTKQGDGQGGERLEHRPVLVRSSIAAPGRGAKHSVAAEGGQKFMTEPLLVRGHNYVLWSPVVGILVVGERYSGRYEFKLYRLLIDYE
ncbi:hypothetical protein DL93DRAFT_2082626 [Clavulina sp. PMI_390]|nr:hypothetical protein DL93DRAFT_2082626 [Clavulina sp. PMI_390]